MGELPPRHETQEQPPLPDKEESGTLPSEPLQIEAPSNTSARTHRELPKERPTSKQRAPLRFRVLLNNFTILAWKTRGKEIDSLEGAEYINQLPEGRNVVVACTHISDLDMPTAAAVLAKHLNIVVSDQSTHHKLDPKNPIEYLGNNKLVGEENFLPIDYKKENGEKVPGRFNPDNYTPMVREMDQKGKVVVVAATNPIENFNLSQEERAQLSGRPGYAVAYLAGIADAVILPVAVYTEGTKVRVVVGEPFEVEGVSELPRNGQISSPEQVKNSFRKLREASAQVLEHVTALLPENLRPIPGQK